MSRKRGGCAFRLVMVLLGLGLGLILAEGACKWLDVRSARQRHEATSRISRPSKIPGVRFELIPNVVSVTPGMRQEVRVNNLGFRGPDVSADKPEGTFRIAVLGDSIAFGRTYHQQEVFTTLLERNLNQRYGEGRFEVINAALSGRDTWEEAALLEHRILPLDPDLVVLQICMNDHVRLAAPDPSTGVGVFGEQPWYGYSSLLRLLDDRMEGFRKIHVNVLRGLGLEHPSGNQFLMNQMVTPSQLSDVSAHWEDWSRELLRIRDLAQGQGAQVLFAVFPTSFRMEEGAEETLPELTAFARENGIPLLDMISFYGTDTRKYLRDYTHPTRLGHWVAAREMEAVIAAYLSRPAAEP